MFGWFRRYVRKIGFFGVEVEFYPPTDTAVASPTLPPPPATSEPPPIGPHGSDSTWFVKWPPPPEVIALRARYKNLIWAAINADEIRRLLGEYWHEEQATWTVCGGEPWSETAEAAFFRAAAKATDRRKGINVMEGVQKNLY